ncbi:MAG TPA: hypothetical protein VIL26_04400 [Clostridia bacterium]
MDDKEFLALQRIVIHNYAAFVLFPAVCMFYIIFGYVLPSFIFTEIALTILLLSSFIPRTKFFIRYPNQIKKKRFLFETISYICCLIFAIGTGFLVKENNGVFSYYFLNIYIQPAFIIFTFVILGYMASTANRIAKIYLAEKKNRDIKVG